MKKYLILLIVSLILASSAFAEGFEISSSSVKDSITLDESAEFLITIISNSSYQEEFKIYE